MSSEVVDLTADDDEDEVDETEIIDDDFQVRLSSLASPAAGAVQLDKASEERIRLRLVDELRSLFVHMKARISTSLRSNQSCHVCLTCSYFFFHPVNNCLL